MSAPVKLGQIGVGYWGKNLLRNFASLPQAEVKRVCELNPTTRTKLQKQYPEIYFTDRYEELLDDPEIEGIVIATQTPLHYPTASKALEAGKHVFVEKPMAQTTREAEHLVELSQKQGRHLMVGHLLLYHPAFRYVEERIREGALGDIFYLYSMRVNLGIVRTQENAFDSLAPHDLAVALQFLDSRPTAISAQGQAYLQPQVEDVVFASVFFENGQMAHLHTSWLDPHKMRKVTIVGSKKMVVIDDVENIEKVRIYDKGVDLKPGEQFPYTSYTEAMSIRTGDILIPRIPMQEPLRLECEHFVTCIRTNQQPRSNAENGLMVVRLLEAARHSLAQNGKAIPV